MWCPLATLFNVLCQLLSLFIVQSQFYNSSWYSDRKKKTQRQLQTVFDKRKSAWWKIIIQITFFYIIKAMKERSNKPCLQRLGLLVGVRAVCLLVDEEHIRTMAFTVISWFSLCLLHAFSSQMSNTNPDGISKKHAVIKHTTLLHVIQNKIYYKKEPKHL